MIRPATQEHLDLLAAYEPEVTELTMAVRDMLLEEAPEAFESVAAVNNAVNASFCFTAKASDTFAFVATYANWVNLGFNKGAGLPDPARILRGDGQFIRYIRVSSEDDLNRAFVRKIVQEAVKQAKRPDIAGLAESVIRAVNSKKKKTD